MTRPSLSDFGTHDESAYPELWRGVVGAWCPSLGPTGSRLYDFSRFSSYGTLTNMYPTTDWVVDGGQYALDFDGSNDSVVMQNSQALNLFHVVAISAWVKPFSVSGQYRAMVYKATNTSQAGYHFGIAPDTRLLLGLRANAHWIAFFSSHNMVANVWQHIYGHIIINAVTVFRNAVGPSSGTLVLSLQSDPNTPVRFGEAAGLNENYSGLIDDVLIFSRALAYGEIQQLYQLGRGGIYTRRTRRSFYIPAGFNVSWARNSNVMLGAGATC